MEWDDPGFGARAAAVHKRLTAALAADAGGPGAAALAGISAQMALMAQLRHLSSELRVRAGLLCTGAAGAGLLSVDTACQACACLSGPGHMLLHGEVHCLIVTAAHVSY